MGNIKGGSGQIFPEEPIAVTHPSETLGGSHKLELIQSTLGSSSKMTQLLQKGGDTSLRASQSLVPTSSSSASSSSSPPAPQLRKRRGSETDILRPYTSQQIQQVMYMNQTAPRAHYYSDALIHIPESGNVKAIKQTRIVRTFFLTLPPL